MTIISPADARGAEVVVIGSGPGGSVVATTLAEAGCDVVMIEEGSFLPQDSCAAFSFEEMATKYRNGGVTVAFGNPNVAYAEGSCVGGGSEVNSGLYHRTPDNIIEEWAKVYQVANLSPDTMAPYFDEAEAMMQPATYPDQLPSASDILRRGAKKVELPSSDVPRLVNYGKDKDEQGVQISARRSMTETYLPRFFAAGGRLMPDTRVSRLIRFGSGWQIEVQHPVTGTYTLTIPKVFVCAGAVHTPALLQRSGIRTNVGRTFSLQPMIKLTAEFKEDVNFTGMGVAGEQVKACFGEFSYGCSISSPGHLAINLATESEGTGYALEKHRKLVSFYVMSRGTLNGSVRAIPGFKDPLVRYRLSAVEMNNLGKGVQGLADLLLAAGAEQVFTGLRALPAVSNSQQLAQLPESLAVDADNIMTVHLMASCPMGENRRLTAVNSWGRVHGYTGLYVADVSTLCNSLGVNPQGTIMALAKRTSEHFLRI